MATVSVERRPAHARSGDRTGRIARLLAPRPSIPSLFDLFFQRPDEMSWQRVVGRLQPLARTHSATVQHAPSGNADALEVRVSCRSEEHTSELQSRFAISYADSCLKKNT